MNVADSQRVASALERLGYRAADQPKQADVIVINTCVVRQSAEDKAHGYLTSLKAAENKPPGPHDQLDGLHGRGKRSPAPRRTVPAC